jgi:hypothetical protein
VVGNDLHVLGAGAPKQGYLCKAPHITLQNGTAQTRATFVSQADSDAIGLAVHVDGSGHTFNDDEIYLIQGGMVMVLAHHDGRPTMLRDALDAPSFNPGAANTLTVTMQESTLRVAVNGAPVTTVTDTQVEPDGAVALAVWQLGMEGAFSQFSVTTDTAGGVTPGQAPGAGN